jgi:3-phenylpropionate/cinnamic acid dioxygenase small subunit
MTDEDAIRNLLGRYCELIDAGDFDGVGQLFADGALADEHGNELARGAEAVAAFYRQADKLYDGSPRTKHLVVNSIIEVDGSDDTATARSSYIAFQQTEQLPLQPIIAGRYQDRFERDDKATGSWRFAERRFFADLVGDLSQHLDYKL